MSLHPVKDENEKQNAEEAAAQCISNLSRYGKDMSPAALNRIQSLVLKAMEKSRLGSDPYARD